MPDLPYFDLLVDEQRHGGELGQLWKRYVHWGYWEDVRTADGTTADFVAAMARLDDVLLDAGRLADGQKVLDVGCGFGGTIQRINAAYTGMELTGLNIDPRQLAVAAVQTTPAPRNTVAWVEGDACELPFEDGTFDRVLAVECVFHFADREKFFAEAQRVLKPGGYLALSDFKPTLMFFGRTPIWHAVIRPRIERSYGTLGKVPLRSYRAMAKRVGLSLEIRRNIRRNTYPTYPFLLAFFREHGTPDVQQVMIGGTRWMQWVTRLGLMQYCVYTFGKPG